MKSERVEMISVVVTIYNVEKYIHKCINSILNQTFKDLEIILVDDGSHDNSGKICDYYAAKDSRIKVIHQANQGVSVARNNAIKILSGDYIGFVDGDDYLNPDMYMNLYNAVCSDKSDIAICGYTIVGEDGKYIDEYNLIEEKVSGKELVKRDGIVSNYVWNKLYHRDLFKSLGFPVGKYFEDAFIMHEIFWNARLVSIIPYFGYNYVKREKSITYEVSDKLLDFIEAITNKIKFLQKHGIASSVIYYWCDKYYHIWEKLFEGKYIDNTSTKNKLISFHYEYKNLYKQVAWKNISLKKRINLFLFALSPYCCWIFQTFYRTLKNSNKSVKINFGLKIRKIPSLAFLCRFIKMNFRELMILKNYHVQNFKDSITDKDIASNELRKYLYYYKLEEHKDIFYKQIEEFFTGNIQCDVDNLKLSADPCVPTVIVVVKNDLTKMQLFFEHYRKLGVHQFIVINNESNDGTFEFVKQQSDTRIYTVTEAFQTQKKEAWIEKVIAVTGYNRWYVVIDSDELIDFVGSEEHSLETMIRIMYSKGYKRLWGLLLDMYSKEPLFSIDCSYEKIPEKFCYFDNESYSLNLKNDINAKRENDEIIGGPRYRVFSLLNTQSKQAIFYFEKDNLYRNCHYLYPLINWGDVPCCFVLRHYKFLKNDEYSYRLRVKDRNFYNDSIEYNKYFEKLSEGNQISFYYEKSNKYENSSSLLKLPFIEKIQWK